jgi:hypothetical protein
MLREDNKYQVLSICIFISILMVCLPLSSVRSFKNSDLTLIINANFLFQEESVKGGYLENYESFNVDLPSNSWRIRDIELNFTSIDYGTEIISIENNTNHGTYKRVYNKNPAQNVFGRAVQLQIDDPSFIYGVLIYGYNYLDHPGIPEIQIRGFDNINHRPNATIIRSVNLNMSSDPGWYLQKFDETILLNSGNYSLVLDGISIPAYAVNDAGFYWAYNSINPSLPSLYASEYVSDWSSGTLGTPFLYKVIQKLNTTIFPEQINMTALLDGNSYSVSNGSGQGSGYVKKTDINYHANKNDVNISVKNNKTKCLRFNIDYTFNIYNLFNSAGIGRIKVNDSTKWSIVPKIARHSNNDTIVFHYPNNWDNITVLKDSVDVSSEVLIDAINHKITILNATIQVNAEWEINGSSPSKNFSLNTPKLDFKTGQELSFSLGSDPLPGNYTLKLYNPLGLLQFQMEKSIPPENTVFSYLVPNSAVEGRYTALVFWSNGTDAGAQSAIFTIKLGQFIPQEFDFSLLLIIGGVIIGSGAAISGGYVTIKKIKSNKREKLNLILERCSDILNLKYIIVLDPKTGIDLFSQSFEKKELDPTLIAGFLQAIHNFGDEVLEGVKDSRTIKVEYKDSIIVMTDFMNVRLITILKSNPSKNFLFSIETLAYHVYKYYGKLIDKFTGNLKPFRSINKLVESDLNVSFRYPMTVKIVKNLKLDQSEKEIVKRAQDFIKENNFDYFYAVYLLPDNACSPQDYETILKLIKKGIFQPLESNEEG